jgi:hypothetical protein
MKNISHRAAYLLITLSACAIAFAQVAVFAQSDRAQQHKDLEQKKRIYGIKHPWENTEPYGTNYAPPAANPSVVHDTNNKKVIREVKKPVAPVKKSTTVKTIEKVRTQSTTP